MAYPYFRNLSEFDYVNRTEGGKNSGDYTRVKNLFKKGVLREDIFQDLSFFTKYIIIETNTLTNTNSHTRWYYYYISTCLNFIRFVVMNTRI